jgi:AcrR family transcriptional regulator
VSKPLWSGDRPKSTSDAKSRICMAALECIKRNGLEKTTMSDIAKEAGIARPTLYKHFKSKQAMLFTGIDTVAFNFAEAVVERANQFNTLDERIVETIVYVVQELPTHRYLSLVLDNECALALRDRAFTHEATEIFSEMTAAPLIEVRPDLADQGLEISEIMSRFAISMILFPGKYASDLGGLRDLIKLRILPGLV